MNVADTVTMLTIQNIKHELKAARAGHKGNHQQLAALVEEVGELAQALIDYDRGKKSSSQVYAEAIQVATMAIRLAEEGSGEFLYHYSHQCCVDFMPKES